MEEEFMGFKISCHCRPDIKRGHNRRDPKIVSAEKHIDPSRPHEIIFDMGTMQECYDKIFGASIAAYNAKQKRSDRKIVNYLAQILSDRRQGKHKNIKADGSRKAAYEMILQIGRADNCPDHKIASEILKAFCKELVKKYPNIVPIGIYLHDDEFSVDKSTGAIIPSPAHIHFDFIIVGHRGQSLKTGADLQSSLSAGLAEMGFKTSKSLGAAQVQFEESVRHDLQSFVEQHGIKVDRTPGEKHKHMDKSVYQQMRENEKEQARLEAQKQELSQDREGLSQCIDEYNQAVNDLAAKQEKSLSERKELLEKKQKQREREAELSERQKQLDEQERDLERREVIVNATESQNNLQKMQNDQRAAELDEREKFVSAGEKPLLEKKRELDQQEKCLQKQSEEIEQKLQEAKRLEAANAQKEQKLALAQNDFQRDKEMFEANARKGKLYAETKKEVEQKCLSIDGEERRFHESKLPFGERLNLFVSNVKKIAAAAISELAAYKDAFKSFWSKKADDLRALADSMDANGCQTFVDWWCKKLAGELDWQQAKKAQIEQRHAEQKQKILNKGDSYGIGY